LGEELIRPIARVTDPVGGHAGNKGWSWMKIGAAIGAGLAIAACVLFPPAGLVGLAVAGLSVVSTTAGAAAIGAQLGKTKLVEDGAPCSEIVKGSTRTKCEALFVARMTDPNSHNGAALQTGAAMVFEGSLPVARVGEASTCGGMKILKGARKTIVGGGSVSSGAPSAADADDAKLDKWIHRLNVVSMVTGLAALPLAAVSAFRAGASLSLQQAVRVGAPRAAFRASYREAVRRAPGAIMTPAMRQAARQEATQVAINSMGREAARTVALRGGAVAVGKTGAVVGGVIVGQQVSTPLIASGIEHGFGVSAQDADLWAQGVWLVGPDQVSLLPKYAQWARLMPKPRVRESWGGLVESVRMSRRTGNASHALFGAETFHVPPASAEAETACATCSGAAAPKAAAGAHTPAAHAAPEAAPHVAPRPAHAAPEPAPAAAAKDGAPAAPEAPPASRFRAAEPAPEAAELAKRGDDLQAHYDEDATWERLLAAADDNGGTAPPVEGLSYTTVPRSVFEQVKENGLLTGRALGQAPGENANNLWFKEGNPFYAEGPTLVIPTKRLLELGGARGTGLAGQPGVVRVPHDAVPEGIPFSEFAVVEALPRGYSEPLHVPSWWEGPLSSLPPKELRPAGAMDVHPAPARAPARAPGEVVHEVQLSTERALTAEGAGGPGGHGASAAKEPACSTCGGASPGPDAVPGNAAAAAAESPKAGERSAWSSEATRSSTEAVLDEMLGRAPAAKTEVDALADDIAAAHGGRVAKAPIKSRKRALEKINKDYAGDATRIKDLARNTIIVPAGQERAALESLKAARPDLQLSDMKIIDGAKDPLGYSGMNVSVRTESGLIGEVQINSPEMIFAKEPPELARAILGDAEYDRIVGSTGATGGLGHHYYEQWRSLPPGSPEADAIAAQSRAYYDQFRR
jgi:hypothetical protein